MNYYNAKEINAPFLFGQDLAELILSNKKDSQPIVILCIGTDRATGDCLGPLIGTNLLLNHVQVTIYGTLIEPVHAVNLTMILDQIKHTHPDAFLIAIDACLGTKEHIGYITLEQGGLYPGESINKELPCVGDIAITGIVNRAMKSNFLILQCTRLHIVMNLANAISSGICFALKETMIGKELSII